MRDSFTLRACLIVALLAFGLATGFYSTSAQTSWEVQLEVSGADLSETFNYFGAKSGASDCEGDYDIMAPPPGPVQNYLRLYFELPDSCSSTSNYNRDIRAPLQEETKTWDFKVNSSLGKGKSVTLSWSGMANVPKGHSLSLTDSVSGKQIDMGAVNSYTYSTEKAGEKRSFQIHVVPGSSKSDFPPGWNLFSPPGTPQLPDPAKALGPDVKNLKLYYNYMPGKGYKSYPDETKSTQLTWKQGYWLWLSSKTPVTMAVLGASGEKKLEFKEEGWQMIGAPYEADWKDADFSDPDDFQTDGAGNVRLVSWDPTNEMYLNHYSDDTYVLDNWRGYWVKVKEATSSDPATVSFTKSDQNATAVGTETSLPKSVDESELDYPPLPKELEDNLQALTYPNPVMEKDQVTFAAQMAGVEKIKVTVTNAAGEVVYSPGYESGDKLTWNLKNTSSNRVANGIYLYQIQATRSDGTAQASEVKRLLILR